MTSIWTTLFGGGSVLTSVENIAKEWIETSTEKAEAGALMLKTLDPNGLMRRQISETVSSLYKVYILLILILILAQAFSIGDPASVSLALVNITELFVPITTSFTAIVGASFGVNGLNTAKGK